MTMGTINCMLNWIVSPTSLVMLAFSWSMLALIKTCEKIYHSFFVEDISNKVTEKSPNVYTYKIVIDTLCRIGQITRAQDVFTEMLDQGIVHTISTFYYDLGNLIDFSIDLGLKTMKPSLLSCSANVSKTLVGTELYTISNLDNEFVLISYPNGLKSTGLLVFLKKTLKHF
ncbi:hypothetical protein L1987_78026 [Smallanthus sonchifolius]|uniref:Uncharacterized protein n=1 Tax=Smallanthus sonchifolius TaxID=185202 RepID=A0ACB8ZBQ1_9ASTR|nr:hypothetical protein L1987_78026 [Smallanthus sonchifolius]